MSPCRDPRPEGPAFPRRPENRPALPRIGYRIGGYHELREAMLRRLDEAVALEGWRYRGADDPGIALVEGAALVGEVLTFYQEHYANEAFLRTAAWPGSVARLARLLGHRPAPGLAGRATFVLEVSGTGPVAVDAGFEIKAHLADRDEAVTFAAAAPLTAWPHLTEVALVRRRPERAGLAAGTRTVEIASPPAEVELRPGDRLLLVPPEPSWLTAGGLGGPQELPQVVEVEAATPRPDHLELTLAAPLQRSWGGPVTAYRVGRSFRHFGHLAPERWSEPTTTGDAITGSREVSGVFGRHVDDHACSLTSLRDDPAGDELPLDREVDDLTPGSRVAVELTLQGSTASSRRPLTLVRTVVAAEAGSFGFGPLSGAGTLLRLDALLNRNPGLGGPTADLRGIRVRELTSPPLTLRQRHPGSTGPFTTPVDCLDFVGTRDEARALAGRRLLVEHPAHAPIEVTVTTPAEAFEVPPGADPGAVRRWPVSLDAVPHPLTPADFDEAAPAATVAGNVLDAWQGARESETVLGSGDVRAAFQTFELKAGPLSWRPRAGATPPVEAVLEVRVDGRLWQRVDTLFGQGPEAEVYVVREDDEGTSWVQFGDGGTGRRLPSGANNVTAAWRTGVGAHGPADPDRPPRAAGRVPGLDGVRLPLPVSGGAEPEPPDATRSAAPGRVQAMGRLVSIQDYETEAATIPGVALASARWGLHDGVPALGVQLLMEAGREAEFAAARDTLRGWERCRGPDRTPLVVEAATRRWVWLELQCALDPTRVRADVEAGIARALGAREAPPGADAASGPGLFDLRRRRIGEGETRRRIEATVHEVEGVLWCRVVGAGRFAPDLVRPSEVGLPVPPRPCPDRLAAGDGAVLQLHIHHLVVTPAPAPPASECAP